MLTSRESLRSRIHLPNWVFLTLLGAFGAGLLLVLVLGNPPTPSTPAGPGVSPSMSPSSGPSPTPYEAPSANGTLQPSYVAPIPSMGSATFVRVNQLSVNPTSTSNKAAPVILSVFVSVVPGSDSGSNGLAFGLSLNDGSVIAGKPRANASGELSYWVDFTIPPGTSSGTLVVTGQGGQTVLLSQVLTWPALP